MIEAICYFMLMILIKMVEWSFLFIKYTFIGIGKVIILLFQLIGGAMCTGDRSKDYLHTDGVASRKYKNRKQNNCRRRDDEEDELSWIDELETIDAILDD